MTRMTVNGEGVHYKLDPETPLLWALRDASNLTGTKYGCDSRDCGACTVIVDGRAVLSCAVAIRDLEGAAVTTIEGLSGGPFAPGPAGVARRAGNDVRLLRAGVHHGHRGDARGQPEPGAETDCGAAQHLPLRRLSADPPGDRAAEQPPAKAVPQPKQSFSSTSSGEEHPT